MRALNADDPARAREAIRRTGLTLLVERAGWLWANEWLTLSVDIDLALVSVSAAMAAPAIGGWMFHSDEAYLAGTDETGKRMFQFAINAPGEITCPEDQLRDEIWKAPEPRAEAAAALAAWATKYAPRPVAAEEILRGMPGPDLKEPPAGEMFVALEYDPWSFGDDDEPDYYAWLFAEDGLCFLYERLGFGSIWETALYDPHPES